MLLPLKLRYSFPLLTLSILLTSPSDPDSIEVLYLPSNMSGTLSTWTASDRDKGQAANAVVLPRKMLAPNTAKLHPSPWNVNTTELENHMAHMKKFAIPEHILRHIGGFVRSPLTQQQLAERLPCFNCFNCESFFSKRTKSRVFIHSQC